MKSKTLIYAILPLSLLGIVFVGIMFHEMVHVFQGKGAESVCIDFNTKAQDSVQTGFIVAHTDFDKSAWASTTEFNNWREYSEKWAGIMQWTLYVIAGFIIGMLTTKMTQKTTNHQ